MVSWLGCSQQEQEGDCPSVLGAGGAAPGVLCSGFLTARKDIEALECVQRGAIGL